MENTKLQAAQSDVFAQSAHAPLTITQHPTSPPMPGLITLLRVSLMIVHFNFVQFTKISL